MKHAEIEVVMLRQMPDAGDECLIERAIVGPFGEHFVDRREVDHGGPVACPGYRQALPSFRPAPGHREVREDKCDELRLGELTGSGVVAGLSVILLIRTWLHEKPERSSPESPIISYKTMS
jgi:hypothetical protein